MLAKKTGIFAEPAAAATVAGLRKAGESRLLAPEESIVLLITGHGLKDVEAAMNQLHIPEPVQPTLAAVERRLDEARD